MQFAKLYSSGQSVAYEYLVKLLGLQGAPKRAHSIGQLARIEDHHNITDIYLWLRYMSWSSYILGDWSIILSISVSRCSMRFPECFTDVERVQQLQGELGKAIGDSLTFSKSVQIGGRPRRHDDIDRAEMQRLLE